MKILYIGNYSNLAADGRSFNTEEHVTRDLASLGHDVVRFQEPRGGGNEETVDQIREAAQGCDLVGWQRTWGLPAEPAVKLWRELEDQGIPSFAYHLDLYRGLKREHDVIHDPFWCCTHTFTPDGNPDSAEWFADQGINHHWMPPAVVSDECYRGTYREDFAHDVVFVGSYGYHPEWPHRRELIDWLTRTYGPRFKRYGGDTGYTVDGVRHAGPVRGEHLNDLYASAKVVVGDSCFASRNQRYFSDRPFETWGRGGFLIFPQIDLLSEMVGKYPSWDIGDWSMLHARIEGALADAYHRDGTVERLHAEVAANHTYRDRLARALDIMEMG